MHPALATTVTEEMETMSPSAVPPERSFSPTLMEKDAKEKHNFSAVVTDTLLNHVVMLQCWRQFQEELDDIRDQVDGEDVGERVWLDKLT